MQQEYVGVGSIKMLGDIIQRLVSRHILLVTGKDSYAKSGASVAVEPLLVGIAVTRFYDFTTNPTLEDIQKGIEVFKQTSPDLVVAIGGGSVIDMAKSINALACNAGEPQAYITGQAVLALKGKPLVAVPTTSGSGSEATHFAVVYIGGKKYSLAHQMLLPDYAIVDPALTYKLTPLQTAVSGMDALCQAIESHWSTQATMESKQYAKEALLLALPNIRSAVKEGGAEARENMALAAHLAGKAINISKTTASHAMSYALTSHFNIPHGHAVALTLPELIVFNDDSKVAELLGAKNSAEAAQMLETLMKDIGLATRLGELGIKEGDIETLVAEMSVERAGNNPRPFSADDARALLRKIL